MLGALLSTTSCFIPAVPVSKAFKHMEAQSACVMPVREVTCLELVRHFKCVHPSWL